MKGGAKKPELAKSFGTKAYKQHPSQPQVGLNKEVGNWKNSDSSSLKGKLDAFLDGFMDWDFWKDWQPPQFKDIFYP